MDPVAIEQTVLNPEIQASKYYDLELVTCRTGSMINRLFSKFMDTVCTMEYWLKTTVKAVKPSFFI